MLLGAARRIALPFLGVLVITVVVSALLGLAAGSGIGRSIAVGLYLLGAALLAGCFAFGVRGPLRGVSQKGETVSLLSARGTRRATNDERSEATQIALLLFVVGILVVLLGSWIDPAHSTF